MLLPARVAPAQLPAEFKGFWQDVTSFAPGGNGQFRIASGSPGGDIHSSSRESGIVYLGHPGREEGGGEKGPTPEGAVTYE